MADTTAYFYAAFETIPSAIDPNDSLATFAPLVTLPDVVAPTVSNVSPTAGTKLASGQLVQFDVLDEQALAMVCVFAEYESGAPDVPNAMEVIWDGFAFAPFYVDFSTRTPVTVGIQSGFRFFIARRGGWPSFPTIRIVAVDKGANSP